MRYNIGDKIVYPMHGAGIIEGMEEREIRGTKQTYYVLKMSYSGEMTVLIPTLRCDEIGIRFVISPDEGRQVLEAFRAAPIEDNAKWNQRHRDNMAKIKSGDIYQVLTVVKELMYRDKTKGLSTSERKMLTNAKQIMVSELVLSSAAGKNDIENIIEDTVAELIK